MAELKTDYKDQLLDSLVNTKRVYNLVDADGNVVRENVSLEDVTVYSQDGDNFGAADINKTNEEVNQLNRNLEVVNNNIKGLIKKTTVTGTTDVNGTLTTQLLSEDVFVISMICESNPFRCLPFIFDGYYRGTIINVYNGEIGDVANMSSITCTVYYVEKDAIN